MGPQGSTDKPEANGVPSRMRVDPVAENNGWMLPDGQQGLCGKGKPCDPVCPSPGDLPTSTCPRSSLHAHFPLPPVYRGTTPSPPRFRPCRPSAGLLPLLPNPLLGSSGPIWFLYHRSNHVQSCGSPLSVAPPLPSPPVTPIPLRSCLTSSHLGKAGSFCAWRQPPPPPRSPSSHRVAPRACGLTCPSFSPERSAGSPVQSSSPRQDTNSVWTCGVIPGPEPEAAPMGPAHSDQVHCLPCPSRASAPCPGPPSSAGLEILRVWPQF